MAQEIIVYALLGTALIYLVFKFLVPRKKKKSGGENCDNCE
jgi:hypothetical protein